MAKRFERMGRFVSDKIGQLGQRIRGSSYNVLSEHASTKTDDVVTTDDSSEEDTISRSDDDEPLVVQFGSNAGMRESFTFTGSTEYAIQEREIDQKQTKLEAPPSKVIQKSGTPYANKKFKVDNFSNRQKRKRFDDDTESDADDEEDNPRQYTSDYFSNEHMAPRDNIADVLRRTKSAPDVSKEPVTINIENVKDLTIGDKIIETDKTTNTNWRGDADLDLVKERTERIINSQNVEGVETEAYKKLKAKTQQSPKLAIMVGKGSNFIARKFLKDNLMEYPRDERCSEVYILERPEEWKVVKKDKKCVVAILVDEPLEMSSDWKKKIKNEILPTLKEHKNIKVVVTLTPLQKTFTTSSGLENDENLHEFVIDIASIQLGSEVRQRVIWHEMDRYGISVCERQGPHSPHTRCIYQSKVAYIAKNTSNLLFVPRVAAFFSRYTEKDITSLDDPYPAYVEKMKRLNDLDALALLALVAFGSRLTESVIESFRAKGFTSDKQFRHSTAYIRHTELHAEVVKIMIKFAKYHDLQQDMWDHIESALRMMSGTVVREYNGVYHFDGRAMQYSFLLSGFIPLDTIIRICDIRFLYNFVLPQALEENDQMAVYLGSNSKNAKRALFERLRDEISEGRLRQAWNHKLMAERWFCEEFLEFLKHDTGKLSTFIMEIDRIEKSNALYFGLEQQFRIPMAGKPANLTELILRHKSYPKWQAKPYYSKSKCAQEAAVLRHAIELERETTVSALLKKGFRGEDDLLLLAIETRNYNLVQELLTEHRFGFKVKCKALTRSLKLFSENKANEKDKRIFQLLARNGTVDFKVKSVKPLIIMATRKQDMEMLKLLTTFHVHDDTDISESNVDHDALTQSECRYANVSKKIDMNLVTSKGKTALTIAIRHQYYEIVHFLLQNGADQRMVTRKNMQLPVMIVIKQDDSHSLSLLMEDDMDIVNVKNKDGRSPLHEAVVGEHLACLKRMLSSDVLHIDAVDGQNETALHKAVAYGKHGIVDQLLKAGANIKLRDIDGNNPLDIAIKMDNLYCAELILKAARTRQIAPDNKILSHALRANNQKLLRILFRCGYDINCENEIYGTPLMFAIGQMDLDLMRFLLKHGADPERKRQGKPPIHAVRRRKDIAILQLLLGYGARIDSTDNSGDTLLHLAVSTDNHDLIADIISLDRGNALIDKPNCNGEMPLHIACKRGNEACARILMRNGATRGVFSRAGLTPQMMIEDQLRNKIGRQEDLRNVLSGLMKTD